MAADASYTLADFQTRAVTKKEAAVIRTWREKSPLMERIKWQQTDSLDIELTRTRKMPTTNWLDIGDALPNMKGTTEPVKERVRYVGGVIDIPRAYTLAKSLVNERSNQEQMATESMAYSFNDGVVNGDPTVNRKEVVGIRYRLVNLLPSEQTILAGGLDVSYETVSTTWWHPLLDLLEQARDACEGNDCDAFVMDRIMLGRYEAALRRSGLLSFTKDQVGVRHMTLGDGGPIFIPAGYDSGNEDANKVIGHTETEDGSALTGGVCTSIYAVKFGKPHLFGFYLGDKIRVEDKGELQDGSAMRTLVDWYPGIAHVSPRSFARVVGIQAYTAPTS